MFTIDEDCGIQDILKHKGVESKRQFDLDMLRINNEKEKIKLERDTFEFMKQNSANQAEKDKAMMELITLILNKNK